MTVAELDLGAPPEDPSVVRDRVMAELAVLDGLRFADIARRIAEARGARA